MVDLVGWWYEWGLFLGLLIAGGAAAYIFYAAAESYYPQLEAKWKQLSVAGALATLPALGLRFSIVSKINLELDALTALVPGADLGNLVDPVALFMAVVKVVLTIDSSGALLGVWLPDWQRMQLFAFVGMVGVLLGLIAVVGYHAQRRQPVGQIPPTQPVTASPISSPPPATAQEASPRPHTVQPTVPPTQPVAPPVTPTAWLVIRSGGHGGRQLPLGHSRDNIIGRDPRKCDIVLDDDAISRQHAKVQYQHGQFVLHDLGSLSGSFINDKRVLRQLLYDGDIIQIGHTKLVYKKV